MVAATDHVTGLTQERLKGLLRYDPETGSFSYPPSRRKPQGRPAGCMRGNGYWFIRIDGRAYYAHRLAWLYMTGAWPTESVDHIDLNRANNRWVNLRAANNQQNSTNRRRLANNTSGFKGVTYYKAAGNWRAYIRVDGVLKFLGGYPTPEIAHEVYERSANEHFGSYARSA